MDIKFRGKYKSLSDFEWTNIPALAILTGKNGVGKSQLLYLLKNQVQLRNSHEHNFELETNLNGNAISKDQVEYWHSKGTYEKGVGDYSRKSFRFRKFEDSIDKIYNTLFPPKDDKLRKKGGFPQLEHSKRRPFQESDLDPQNTVQKAIVGSIEQVEKTSRKKLADFTKNDIALYFPFARFLDLRKRHQEEMGFPEICFHIFVQNEMRKAQGIKSISDQLEILDIINSSLRKAFVPLELKITTSGKLNMRLFNGYLNSEFQFRLYLWNDEIGKEFDYYDLSSGEKVLVDLAVQNYFFRHRDVKTKVVVMDEPTAHLHPSMINYFFRIISNTWIKEFKVSVIIATQSLNTISLAPPPPYCKIYELTKQPTLIREQSNRDEVITRLGEGLIFVNRSTRFVLVEGKDDVPFYEAVYDIVKRKTSLKPFTFIKGAGKGSVHHWTDGLQEVGLGDRFRGIIDKDHDSDKLPPLIFRLQRYSIENYLLDPLLIWVGFLGAKYHPVKIKGLEVKEGMESQIANFSPGELQTIANAMLEKMENVLEEKPSVEESELQTIYYTNGKSIRVPNWLLFRRGKTLHSEFTRAFKCKEATSIDKLIANMCRTQLISSDFPDLFDQINQ